MPTIVDITLSPEARALVDQAEAQGFGRTVSDAVALARIAAVAPPAEGDG
jgi:hypothetical protein